ncbi:hypothetical protein MNBD_GAMMA10-1576 [hydrothermal vent metagenome]|uniref:Uncharacterized protein n=1 Tax=hydrothermal vent metagenome TaxID=652676 RepID=A0A3B0XP25_9ZZZZ
MNDNDFFEKIVAEKNLKREKRLKKSKDDAKLNGKEPFDLNKLKKHWSYRFEKKLSAEELEGDMRKIEKDYYLAGEQFMTIESYGKHLMEMELYR